MLFVSQLTNNYEGPTDSVLGLRLQPTLLEWALCSALPAGQRCRLIPRPLSSTVCSARTQLDSGLGRRQKLTCGKGRCKRRFPQRQFRTDGPARCRSDINSHSHLRLGSSTVMLTGIRLESDPPGLSTYTSDTLWDSFQVLA
jgi:hypothetical protein